jgi:hypothetical protein
VVENNDQLTSLAGLENVSLLDVTWIGPRRAGLYVIENPLLTTLDELESLEVIRGDIRIFENRNLISVAALENIRGYRNDLRVIISRNPSLDCTPPPVLPFIVDESINNLVNCPTN